MCLMFLAAACRHSAGFTWAYNCRLYFLTYFPHSDVGTFFSVSAIVGGATGVIIGGAAADKLSHALTRGYDPDRMETKVARTRIKLSVLGFAMVKICRKFIFIID